MTCAWASSTCLSGSICCAKASTLPEVSLVAVLDADKEGFLRSDRSLIQTIGRAARNINGTAILYADTLTGSMRRAIDETSRRRRKQIEFNQAHGIIPKGIRKAVADIMEGARYGCTRRTAAPWESRRVIRQVRSDDTRHASLHACARSRSRCTGTPGIWNSEEARSGARPDTRAAGTRAGRSDRQRLTWQWLAGVDTTRYRPSAKQARSSVVEHHVDIVGVGGSIPLAPTTYWMTPSTERLSPSRTVSRISRLVSVDGARLRTACFYVRAGVPGGGGKVRAREPEALFPGRSPQNLETLEIAAEKTKSGQRRDCRRVGASHIGKWRAGRYRRPCRGDDPRR